MSIERLGPHDVPDVAALHGASIAGLLTQLGPVATRAYYRAASRSRAVTAFVARDAAGIAGFVLGSATPAGLRREVLARDPVRVLSGIALGVLRRPATLRWLVRSRRGPDAGHYDATGPELIYLAVSPSRRGRGTGRRLVAAFGDAMRAAGHARFELSVDADNRDAARFYEKLGFTRIGEYEEFGVRHVRYAMTLPGPA